MTTTEKITVLLANGEEWHHEDEHGVIRCRVVDSGALMVTGQDVLAAWADGQWLACEKRPTT